MRYFTNFFTVMVMSFLLVFGADLFARGGKSGGSSSSRRSSPASSFKSTKSTPKRITTKKSTIRPKTKASKNNKATVAKKATSKNKMDKKLSKQTATKNKAAAKKYGNKKAATQAYKKKMASSNKYNSKTPPAKRPAHIPQSVMVNGRSVNTTYHALPGGGYGYGHMAANGLFMALAANQMMVNNAMMSQAGFGTWNPNGTPMQPVVHHNYAYSAVGFFFFVLVVVVVIALLSFTWWIW